MRYIKIKIFTFFFLVMFSRYSFAGNRPKQTILSRNDPELIQSSKCVAYFKVIEYKYNLPADILHSISLQESGRKHSKSDKKIPWPWTVNVKGKGYFFDNKKEAVNFVEQQRAFGKRSIDVGCMQINLLYHPEAFKNISEAFEPKVNIAYGASFLKEKYIQYGSWKKAIANYHSANETLGTNYQKSVLKIASNIAKHKFNPIKSNDMLTQRRALYASNFNKNAVPYFKQARYKSDMMVHIPRNAYRRIN